jgi:hypothetical protein
MTENTVLEKGREGDILRLRMTAEREIERRKELRKIWLELNALAKEQQEMRTKAYVNSQKTLSLAQRVFDLIND